MTPSFTPRQPGDDSHPHWSPGARNSEVFVMNADGSNPVDVSKSAAWSRDGRHIYAFQHRETEEFGNLAVFEVRNP